MSRRACRGDQARESPFTLPCRLPPLPAPHPNSITPQPSQPCQLNTARIKFHFGCSLGVGGLWWEACVNTQNTACSTSPGMTNDGQFTPISHALTPSHRSHHCKMARHPRQLAVPLLLLLLEFTTPSVTGTPRKRSSSLLSCYHCTYQMEPSTHGEVIQPRRMVAISPLRCARLGYCRGEWCVQQLDSQNASFHCADRAPLEEYAVAGWTRDEIDSQCRAFYGPEGAGGERALHATCYCRGEDYCNRGGRQRKGESNTRLISLLIILMVMSGGGVSV